MRINADQSPSIYSGPLRHLLEAVDDVRCVIKDLEGRYIYVNKCWYESNGYQSEQQIIGKKASDLFPAWRAERYLKEDQRVIDEGHIYNYEEFLLNADGELERWRTMKAPWIENNSIKGYVNVGTRIDSKELEQRSDQIPRIVLELANSACLSSNINEIAHSLGISRRTLERKFRDAMNMSPQEFRTKCRVLRAKKMLRHGMKISLVAAQCGFADQSHFSRTFRKSIGLSPKQYQMNHRAHS